MVSYEALDSHETMHWFQHNGTTIGVFLSLLRYSQQRTAINFMHKINKKERKMLFDNRNEKKRQPIVAIDTKGDLLYDNNLENRDLIIYPQIWYDHQFVYSLLEHSHNQDTVRHVPRGQVFGEIVGDTILYFCEATGIEYPGHQYARSLYQFKDDKVFFVKEDSQRITTRSLFEGVASANELSLLVLRGAPDSIVNKVKSNLFSGTYGVGINAFMRRLNISQPELMKFIPTFNVLCDIALNPPLPPFFINAPLGRASWDWVEIYPPLRFLQLIQQVPKLGYLPSGASHDLINNYVNSLCDLLNWPSPTSYKFMFTKDNGLKQFPDAVSKTKTKISNIDLDYYHYLLWVQANIWEQRKDKLPFFTNMAECKCDSKLFMHFWDLIKIPGYLNEWGDAPFRIVSSANKAGFMFDSKKFNQWLFISSCFHNMLFDLMTGSGKIDFSSYGPLATRNIGLVNSVIASLSETFDYEFSANIV